MVQLLYFFFQQWKELKAYANENGEFPLNKKVELPELLKSWGSFKAQDIDFEKLGTERQKAVLIFDQIGWK